MNNLQFIEIGRRYEYSLKQYFQEEGIYPHKSKCGAIKLPSVKVLDNSKDIILNCEYNAMHRKRLFPKPVKRLPDAIRNCDKCEQDRHSKITISEVKKKNLMKCSEQYKMNTLSNEYFHGMNMQVWLKDSRSAFPNARLPSKHILNAANNGKEIFDYIMQRNYGSKENVIADIDMPKLFILLEEFQKHHKRFHYSSVLTHMLGEKQQSRSVGEREVAVKQLSSYITFVILKVAPLKLFGKCKNRQKIIKAVCHLLRTARFEPLNLKRVIVTLDIPSIEWLNPVKKKELQWFILAKLLKWFFIDYIIKTLRCLFYVTTNPDSPCQKFFIRCGDWYRIQNKFEKVKESANVLHMPIQIDRKFLPPGKLILFPKRVGVRPVIKTAYTPTDKSNAALILKFLSQLYVTKYGMAPNANTFHARWKSLKKHHSNDNLKFVSSDLTDAFGSVRQEKLYDILWTLCEDLPDDLIYRPYVLFDSKAVRRNDYSLIYRRFFSDDILEPSIKPGMLYARDDSKKVTVQIVKKNWLLQKIEKYISYQTINIRKKTYVIRKGLAQGIVLSPILSDIYYSFVLEKHFHRFIKTGFLFRYMDDILYITRCEDIAARFIALTKKGISTYNCRFKPSKTQTNINCHDCVAVETINFIGYKLHCKTLEVTPAYPDAKPHYAALSFKRNTEGPLAILKRRLFNIGSLKLTNIVLDNSINPYNTLISVLKQAFYMQVCRAKALILTLFDDIAGQAEQIFAVIKGSNKRIFRTIRRTYFKRRRNVENTERNRKYIMQLLCNTYKESFSTHPILHEIFVKNVFDRMNTEADRAHKEQQESHRQTKISKLITNLEV